MNDQAIKVVSNLFSTMEVETLRQVMSSVQVIQCPVDTYICHEGATERSFYIIVAGEVAISKLGLNGIKQILDFKRPGDYFGEMALLRNKPRTADVYTTSESVLIQMDLKAFREVISKSPQFLDHLMNLMNKYDENHQRLRRPMIFISYSRKDQDVVKRIVTDLKQELQNTFVDLWFDQINIGAGHDWDESIEDALQKTTAMLLVLSANSIKSKNVKSEWNYCMEEGKIIIPVLIDNTSEIPFRLKTYHHIDLSAHTDRKSYSEGLERIIMTLKEIGEQATKS